MTLPMNGLPMNYMNQQYWQTLAQLINQQQTQQQQQQQQELQNLLAMRQAEQQQQEEVARMNMQQQLAAQQAQTIPNAQMNAVPPQMQSQVGDGKDDGKISFGKKCGNFFKGVGNFFKGMVCDENGKFSIKRTLTTAAIAAGAVALTVATGGAATPFLIAGGAALGAVQVGKGAYKAATANTDAEAEMAWQDIGSGTTAVVGSLAGAKGALKSAGVAIPKGNALTSSIRATGQCFKISGKGSMAAMKSLRHPTTAYNGVKTYWSGTAKPNLVKAFSPKNARTNLEEQIVQKETANLNKAQAKIDKINEELAKPDLSAEKVAKLTKELQEVQAEQMIAQGKIIKAQTPENLTARNMKDIKEFRDSVRKSLEDNVKNAATKEDKLIAEKALKSFDDTVKFSQKVETVNYQNTRLSRAQKMLDAIDNELKATGISDARKAALETQKTKIKSIMSKEKTNLFKTNFSIAAKQTLPKTGLAYGTYYLAGAAPQLDNTNSEEDAYAQANGFNSAQEMMDYYTLANAQQKQQMLIAQSEAEKAAAQYPSQYPTNSMAMQNPYGQYNQNMFGQAPQAPTTGFQDLYVSPYPPMI